MPEMTVHGRALLVRRIVEERWRVAAAAAATAAGVSVRIVAVRPGDTAQSLAAGMPFPGYAADLFRVLNGLDSGADALAVGRRVKVVSDESGGSRAGY